MLVAKFLNYYRKSASSTVFRFVVSGTPEELATYKEIQGDNYRTDNVTGKPLYFTTRYFDDTIKLVVTSNPETGDKRIVADDSELVKLQNLINNFGADTVKLAMFSKNNAVPAGE